MDKLTPDQRSKLMSSIRSKDMIPEIIVRQLLHKMGYRFRLHVQSMPGKPDVVLSKHRKIVFVHGSSWHQHNNKSCKKSHLPKSNIEYWIPKLKRNAERDKKHFKELKKLGWSTLIIWECETKDKDTEKLASKIKQFMNHEIQK